MLLIRELYLFLLKKIDHLHYILLALKILLSVSATLESISSFDVFFNFHPRFPVLVEENNELDALLIGPEIILAFLSLLEFIFYSFLFLHSLVFEGNLSIMKLNLDFFFRIVGAHLDMELMLVLLQIFSEERSWILILGNDFELFEEPLVGVELELN